MALGAAGVCAAPQGTNSEEYCACLASCYQGPCGVCVAKGHVPEEVLPGPSKHARDPLVRHLWPEATQGAENDFAARWTDIGVPGFCRTREARHRFTGRCYFDAETDGGAFVPSELRAFGWSCAEYCRYECARNVTEARERAGEPVLQYHGAWPFVRVGPFIQFWSMVFSIGNLLPHAVFVCHRPLRERFAPLRRLPQHSSGRAGALLYPLSPVLVLHGVVGMNAWFWSTVYHARDTVATQRMDVHCATLYVAFSVYVLLLRILRWDPPSVPARALGLAIFGSLLLNFLYLDFVRWDFQYNLSITISAVVLYAVTGFAWVLLHRRRAYAWKLGLTLALLLTAGLLEVFDFAPVLHSTLDAHAVWHLATIPLTVAWYLFLIDDTQFELARAAQGAARAAKKDDRDRDRDDDAVTGAPLLDSILSLLRSAGSLRNRAAVAATAATAHHGREPRDAPTII